MRYVIVCFLVACGAIAGIVCSASFARAGVLDAPTAGTNTATRPTITRATTLKSATQPTTQASTRATTRGALLKFPTWGIELAPPQGWTRMPESDFTVMAQWAPSDGTKGVFRVLVTPMLQRSVATVADSMAKGLRATISNTTLDGRIAKKIEGGADGTSAIIAQREGYLIELRYHGSGKRNELEEMRKSWRWTDVESPAKHPEVRPDLIQLSNEIVVQFPTHFRSWPIPPPLPGTVRYAAVDLTRQRIRREFDAEFAMPPDFQGQPLDKLATRMSEPIQNNLVLKKPIAWRVPEGKDDRIISQQIVGPPPANNPKGAPAWAKCLAVIALDNNRRLIIVFNIATESDDDRFAFMNMAEQIVGSVRAGQGTGLPPAPVPTTAPSAAATPTR